MENVEQQASERDWLVTTFTINTRSLGILFDEEKKGRLIEHLNWAKDNNQLQEISDYLHSLDETEWFHKND